MNSNCILNITLSNSNFLWKLLKFDDYYFQKQITKKWLNLWFEWFLLPNTVNVSGQKNAIVMTVSVYSIKNVTMVIYCTWCQKNVATVTFCTWCQKNTNVATISVHGVRKILLSKCYYGDTITVHVWSFCRFMIN